MTLPVLTDLQDLRRRLAIEEDHQRRDLARLEDRLRRFEDNDRPAYERWLRLELGPILTTPAELSAELRLQRMIAERDGIGEGLVCVFSIREPCRTFSRVRKEHKAFVLERVASAR